MCPFLLDDHLAPFGSLSAIVVVATSAVGVPVLSVLSLVSLSGGWLYGVVFGRAVCCSYVV